MTADAATANVIIIGGDTGVIRTVLRSEVLKIVRGEPLHVIVAVAAAALLATPDHNPPIEGTSATWPISTRYWRRR